MKGRILVSTLLAGTLAIGPAHRAAADAGDAIAGAIVGGIIGNAIARDQQRRTTTVYRQAAPSKKTYSSGISSAQRAENRSVQHALNYFAFNAGGADGVLGRNSRAAISSYQAHMGYPATGQLTQYEKDFLLTSHNRALAGGPTTNQLIAANPMGPKGLLITYRDQLAGGAMAGVVPPATTTVVVNPAVAQPAAPAPVPVAAEPAAPVTEVAVDEGPKMPSFLGEASEASLASHCNAVNLMTNANGGFATLASMSDPAVALNEQFCLARTYAIAQSEQLIGKVQGVSAAEITAQCKQLAPLLKDQVAAMSVNDKEAVVQQVSQFVLSTGMSPAQMVQTAKICLGDGYRVDDLNVALGSALILVVLGEPVYGELLGHHLSQGFGASKRPDLSLAWYQSSADAIARGTTPVFAPGQEGRNELILTAASELNGTGSAPRAIQPQAASSTAMPSFQISQ
ncbi:peptidoglycan-binding domain-containing protein [Tropicimonas aquimaris]|uniref:Peptidoglycan-binding domain-containing protein n=1 Tax=Tropicimonas aquimaris TaxID=914152 RepID=A0ABW3IW89_9RHOB